MSPGSHACDVRGPRRLGSPRPRPVRIPLLLNTRDRGTTYPREACGQLRRRSGTLAQPSAVTLGAVEAWDFETFRAALGAVGFHEAESRYEEGAFGSWAIVFDDPPARVVWDGKGTLARLAGAGGRSVGRRVASS
jgi:hypothetical protein